MQWTAKDRKKSTRVNKYKWHVWFAWYPVKLNSHYSSWGRKIVWWERILRKKHMFEDFVPTEYKGLLH